MKTSTDFRKYLFFFAPLMKGGIFVRKVAVSFGPHFPLRSSLLGNL